MQRINFWPNVGSFDCPRSINRAGHAHDCVCCHSPSNLIECPGRPMYIRHFVYILAILNQHCLALNMSSAATITGRMPQVVRLNNLSK